MTAAISAELFKLRTTRAPWIVAGLLVVLALVGAVFLGALLGDPGQPALEPAVLADFVRAPGRLVGGAALLLGLLLTTSEYRHRTVLTSRLAVPTGSRLVLAKLAAAALAGAVLAVAIEAIMFGGGVAVLGSHGVAVQPMAHGLPIAVASLVVVAALHAIAGAGIGELLRNPALAVGVVLGWTFIAEGVVPSVLQEPDAGRWLPVGAIESALAAGQPPESGLLAPAAGLALLVAYVAGMAFAGLVRARRTDP